MRREPILLGSEQPIEINHPVVQRERRSEKAMPWSLLLQRQVKRSMDVGLSVLIIVIALPLMGVIAIVIVLDSGLPVLFCQERHGCNGAIFRIYKFRTMKTGADDGLQTTRCDPRVTRIGRFLRRSSLDELPQIFNVLRGDMSLVGPRPHPIWLDYKYAQWVEDYMARLEVRPGITGLAQVKGARGEIRSLQDICRRVALDRQYIEHWSLLLDLRILALTGIRMWFDDHAY